MAGHRHKAAEVDKLSDVPDLLTISQIADLLGVSSRTAHRFVNRDDWPEPYAELPSGRVWARPKVEAWARRPPVAVGRGRGRPTRA